MKINHPEWNNIKSPNPSSGVRAFLQIFLTVQVFYSGRRSSPPPSTAVTCPEPHTIHGEKNKKKRTYIPMRRRRLMMMMCVCVSYCEPLKV